MFRGKRWSLGYVKPLTLGVTVSLLVACGNNIKPVTDADIQAAKSNSELVELYQKLQADLKKTPDNATLKASVEKVGQALAMRKFSKLRADLDQQRDSDGLISVNEQNALSAELEDLKHWDAKAYTAANQLLSDEQSKRETKIAQLQQLLNDTPISNLSLHFSTSDAIYALDEDVDTLQQRHRDIVAKGLQQADNWHNNAEYGKAEQLLVTLSKHSESPEITEKLENSRFKAKLQSLKGYQEQGDVDSIYYVISGLAESYTDKRYQLQLRPFAVELSQYYNLMAQSALAEQNLQQAYDQLQRVSTLSTFVPAEERDISVLSEFLSEVYVLARDAFDGDQPALSFAYLSVMEDFNPMTPEQASMKEQASKILYDQSVLKLAATQFDSPSNAPGLGAMITASLVEHFVNTDRKDIRILERDSIDSVLKEQEIKALQEGGEINLSTADFLVQGAVVEANVDESTQKTQKTKRVVTDVKEIPNPEFKRWQELSEEARKREEKPSKTLEEEIKENVSFTVTELRKLGSVTASFRIINPANAKLLHAETLALEEKHSGTNVEGMEIGLFKQEAQTANLPANNRILRNLTQSQAEQIASKLVEKLQNPEERYLEQALAQREVGNTRGAVTELGKAIMMKQAKEQPAREQLEMLKSLALQVN